MNCGEFDQRMQRLIDDRIPLAGDEHLAAHATWCDDCRDHMLMWEQIDSVVPFGIDSTSEPLSVRRAMPVNDRSVRVAWSVIATVAAALLIAFLVSYNNQDHNVTPVANNIPREVDEELEVDPARWWRDVQDRDWIGQTMPAVQSVRDGVAPLGRSIKQALAILTTGGGEKAS